MRNMPGVAVHQGEGYRDEIVIRGVDTKGDFFVNGMRDDGERLRDMYNIKQIDVLQGPAALLFGRGGAGGVVNVITKKAERAPIRELTLEAGSWQRRRATLDVGNAIGETAAYRINLMGEDADSYRQYMNGHRYGINPSFAFNLGSNTTLDISLEREYDRRFIDRGIPARGDRPVVVPRSRTFVSEAQNFARTIVHGLDASLEHVFNDSLALRNTLRLSRLDHFHENVYPGSDVAPDDTLSLTAYHHRDRRNGLVDQLELIQKLDTGNVHHTILYGLEAGLQVDDNVRYQGGPIPNVPLANPLLDIVIDRPELSNHFIGQDMAGYIQDQIDFSSRWKVLAGIRWEQFRVAAKYHFQPEGTRTKHVDRMWSPSLGAMYALTENTSLYASVARTLTPAGSSLSLSLRTPDAADLPPEEATNYEFGAKASMNDDKLILTAAVFQLDQEHVRARHPVIPDLLVPAGSQRNRGFELGATGYINPQWSIYAGYARLDAKIQSSTELAVAGAHVGLVPRDRVTVWSRYDINDHWGVGGGWVAQSKVYTTFSNNVVLPGYGRIDGLAYYRWRNYKINLNVNNIFDRHYYATAQGDNQITLGDPRSFNLMFTMNM
jgi:catecholate siderophore receptor